MMEGQERVFKYTRERGAYISMIAAITFYLLLESAVIVLLIVWLVKNVLLEEILIGSLILLLLALFFFLLMAPLRTSHRLTASYLNLHYGLDRVSLPRDSIIAAKPVREPLGMLQSVRARIEPSRHCLVAAFSTHGQVLLYLDRLYSYRVNSSDKPIDCILINVDEREEFLQLLGLPAVPTFKNPEERKTPSEEATGSYRINAANQSTNLPGSYQTIPAAIQTEGLTRTFGNLTAVDNIHLHILPGEIYCFLGPNGAGKTTTIKMLVGILKPSQGQVWINRQNLWADPISAKAAFGYVADRAILYERLTAVEFLQFLAQMRGIPREKSLERIEHLIDLLELSGFASIPCSGFSFGMKRKLALAGALIHDPPVLILDEPLIGLDPISSRRLKDLFAVLASKGTTVFLSTHDLSTAEAISHRVGIIHRGKLLAEGEAGKLSQLTGSVDLEDAFLALTSK